jgi:Tripartite tricarboxylate transporter TctB family
MPSAQWRRTDWRPVFFIAVLLLFVAGIPYLGFDLAIFFFVIAALWLFGERRVLFSLSLALGIAVLCAGCVLGCALGLQAMG